MNSISIIIIVSIIFIPINMIGLMIHIIDPIFMDSTPSRVMIAVIFFPLYLVIASICIMHKYSFETLSHIALIIIFSAISLIQSIHMMYLKFGSIWSIILRADKTIDKVSLVIASIIIGASFLSLTILYIIGFSIINRFSG